MIHSRIPELLIIFKHAKKSSFFYCLFIHSFIHSDVIKNNPVSLDFFFSDALPNKITPIIL